MIRIEHNAQTGEIIEIELTPEEIANKLAHDESIRTQEQEKISSKAALLARLGITADEAKLLLS
jgi:hypothetical protein